MDRKHLIDKEMRRRGKNPDKFNSAYKSNVGPTSVKLPSEHTGCIYSKEACQKISKDGFRPCWTSKHEDGSNPRFCGNVPIEARASLASRMQESIKNREFEESWER
jgi:hypothetical protein